MKPSWAVTKLMLREGERFLDIGAGWGALLRYGDHEKELFGGERVMTTTNRNFEGRQGAGSRRASSSATTLAPRAFTASTLMRGVVTGITISARQPSRCAA